MTTPQSSAPPITRFVTAAGAVAAGATCVYKGVLQDQNGAAVGSGSVSAMTLSLVDTPTGAIVNGVNAVDILNTGRGTLDSNGNLTITLGPSDTALLRADSLEIRSMVFACTYTGGTLRHQVDIAIAALAGP